MIARVSRAFWCVLVGWTCCLCSGARADELKILFLGDSGHHRPADRAAQITPVLAERGIAVDYTEDIQRLTLENLQQYDGLLVYANIDTIDPQPAAAILEYVANGGGFIPIHCASYCFRNSPELVDLIGGQFWKHGVGEFETEIVAPEHPVMRGFSGFRSWDETYIHTKHNPRNRVVLEVRRMGEQAEGRDAEPWTWVRTHGRGRVFYTAWGHDQRTWGHPGFHNLLERGIRWACGQDPSVVPPYRDAEVFPVPQMTSLPDGPAPFEYVDVGPKIPNYVPGQRWGAQGEPMTLMQKPLPPEASMQRMVLPIGFHLELFAAEPMFGGKPIAMNWDHRGRLWVCVTVDYPNELQPPGQGNDAIRILEDTDGDGRADQVHLFADKLSIPTTLEFVHGGVIVQSGVETLFLRDNDGDDRADERRTLVSGWAMGDTHGGVSNFMYGLDNRIWAMQGYNDSHPRYAGGRHPGFRQGPFAMTIGGTAERPEVVDVEFIRSTSNNSWGLGISEEGLIFASTANRDPSVFIPIPNRYYERVRGWAPRLMAESIAPDHLFQPITDKVRQVDHHGGYTAAAGHALYTARSYPQAWWNRTAFVCGPTGHLVGTFVLRPRGSSFESRYTFNLLASDDEWAAPIMAEVGPDGAVWVIDWYNYIVQHNPTPQGFETGKGNAYVSDLRDKTHGRVYRVVYDGEDRLAGAEEPPQLDPQHAGSLVAALSHPNRLWRRHAQRLLVERGNQDVVPELVALVSDTTVDAVDNNPGAVHALWTLKGLGALDKADGLAFDAAIKALEHPASGVRRNAALVLPAAAASTAAILKADGIRDPHPQVRLAALMALADMPADEQAGRILAQYAGEVVDRADRPWFDALVCASATHAKSFLMAIAQDDSASARLADLIRIIAEHQAREGFEAEELVRLLQVAPQASVTIRSALVEGLVEGSVEVELTTAHRDELEQSLAQLFDSASAGELAWLIRLGKVLGSNQTEKYASELIDSLLEQFADPDQPLEQRKEAVTSLIGIMGDSPEVIEDVIGEITPQMPSDLVIHAVRTLAAASADNVAEELLSLWPTTTPSVRSAIAATLLARPSSSEALLSAIENGEVLVNDLTLDQRQSLLAHPNRRIRQRAARVLAQQGTMLNQDRQAIVEKYHEATTRPGNVSLGKELFVKNCAACHKHSGLGQEIGPDLTGMAVHPKEELLVHILDPNRSVEGNFRRYTVLTADGQVLTGMLAAESLTSIEIVDAEAKRHLISRDDIEEIRGSNQSLMPEGFEQQLSVEDMAHLLEFLTAKGKFVPLPFNSVATAVSTQGLFHDGNDGPDRIVLDKWGIREVNGVPFNVLDPQGDKRKNIILLHGPRGTLPPRMPQSVSLPINTNVHQLHLLSGISGWGYPAHPERSVSMIVRFHFDDGTSKDVELLNGVHFADYIRRVDVPGSQFAFSARGQQVRYLAVSPESNKTVSMVEFVKGDDPTAPIIVAATVQREP
ncbi:MAG: glycosyl hydrolase [Pirellulaceae bacterium]|nr:MAG: glycosyl hydrolase [Pirellulaceae bacterium]